MIMKKIFFLMSIVVMIFALPSKAQITFLGSNGLGTDTVTNSASKMLVGQVPLLYNESVTMQVDITKISGTLAGTLTPIASNDGTTYYDISSRTSRDTSVTVTNSASFGYNFVVPLGFKYYGVKWTGSGTMSGSITMTPLARKSH